ncbi:MAG: DNA primase [Candidatus Taylorbacteria bacterium]|nr:DNA primase [Candidatus Taylorbacteria bacterium]
MRETEIIKERLPIAGVIGAYLKLEKAGVNLKALCPFHSEKTASFFVSPERGGYYCFGCGAKGDIFTFVQTFEGLDFPGALKLLAERAGVRLSGSGRRERKFEERLFAALEKSASYFEGELGGRPEAVKYLKDRGLAVETIEKWRLGFAPAEWRALKDSLIKEGFSEEELVKAGLIKRGEKGNVYDTFRSRIIFPLFDPAGRVAAFSGRIFGDDSAEAKYLNSPDTPLWSKSSFLYGFHAAKRSIRESDYTLVVEGQMDLLMCHQAGLTNAVAVSGTALTARHLALLRRLSPNLLLVFDNDPAGVRASLKAAELALGEKMTVKLAKLSGGKDPAELIKEGAAAFRAMLRDAKHVIDFHLEEISNRGYDKRRLHLAVGREVLPHLARLQNAIERSHFAEKVAAETGIKESALLEELGRLGRGEARPEEAAASDKEKEERAERKEIIGERLLSLLFWQESLKESAVDAAWLRKELCRISGESWLEKGTSEADKDSLIFRAEREFADVSLGRAVNELLRDFEMEMIKARLAEVSRELKGAESRADAAAESELIDKCRRLSGRLSELGSPP